MADCQHDAGCKSEGAEMTDDLVKRLRELAGRYDEAADRIEKLEEALFESMALNINYHAVEEKDGYEFTEAPIVIDMARKALEGKDD